MPNDPATAAPVAPPPAAPADAPKPAPVDAGEAPLSPSEIAELRAAKAQFERMSAEQAKAQAEADRARLAEMAPLEADATRWRAHVAAETKRLDESAASLPPTFAALYKRATDVDGKREVLEAYAAVTAAAPRVPATPPAGAAPPGKASIDFAAEWSSGRWEQAKAADPAGAAAWLAAKTQLSRSSGGPSLGIARFTSPPKAQ